MKARSSSFKEPVTVKKPAAKATPATKPAAKKAVAAKPAVPAAKKSSSAAKAPATKPKSAPKKPATPSAKAATVAKKPVKPAKSAAPPEASAPARSATKTADAGLPPSKTVGRTAAVTSAPPIPMKKTAAASSSATATPSMPAQTAAPAPARGGRVSRLSQLTVPSMPQSVASTAAKSSFSQAPSNALVPPPPVAVKKDPKLANNWKAKSAAELTDAEVIAMPDAEYYELNFSPSGQWAAYQFSGYRNGMRVANEITEVPIEMRSSPDGCALQASLSLDQFRDLPRDRSWCLGLSAVIEDATGGVSYWALAHPPGKPDFHHADNFACKFSPAVMP